jgi:PAS domain S-box-containing protein
VLLGVIGLFFGWIPALIAILLTGAFRIYQGGNGMVMGVAVIIVSALIGLIWNALRIKSLYKLSWLEIYIFGLVVHAGMLLCTFLLPEEIRAGVQSSIWLPVLTIYPLATLLLGALLVNRLRRDRVAVELTESESKYKFLFETMSQGVVIQDSEGRVIEANRAASGILGLSMDQLLMKTSYDSRWKMINEDGTDLDPKNTPSNLALRTGETVRGVTMGVFVPEINKHCWILTSSTPRFREGEKKPYLTLTTFTDVTELKNVQNSLKESENKFHGLFDSMVEGVAIHELLRDDKGKAIDYRILEVNDSFGIQTGITSDVRGKLATEAYGVDKPPYLKEYEEVVKSGRSLVMEKSFEPLQKTFKIAVFLIENNQFATVFEDITIQKKIMVDLQESEEKFSRVFKSSPYIIIMTRADDGKIVEINDAFARLSGYTREEALESTSILLKLWGNIEDREAVLEEIKTGKQIINREYPFRKKNGEVLMGSFSAQILVLKGVPYILAIIEDITKRRVAEDNLAKINSEVMNEKHKLEAILRDMGDAVFVTDDKKNIILVNRAMERLFGLSESEMKGKNIEKALALSYETTGEKPKDLIDTVFEKKRLAKPENTLVIKNKSGTSVSVDGVASPIVDKNGELAGTVWVLRDVSRERELQKMRLDFISLASHQLRTPLTGIKWFVELLNENAPKMPIDRVVEYVRKIGDSNERMIDLVNDLMTTSRADSGSLHKDISSYPVKDLLQQAIDGQGRLFLDKNIQIEGIKEIPLDLELEVDMVQMSEVFGNLFNNAASYSPVGSAIEVKTELTDGKVIISVKDSGVGIPVEQQGKVFEKFFRADNVAKTVPGSGLGLYVAKSMVESHGGKIWFESKENLGTTFFVELPIKQKDGKKEESDDRGG